MSAEPLQTRHSFPHPDESAHTVRRRILALMIDGVPRSIIEIQDALGTRKEIGARIRELRNGKFGPRWNFNDPRAEGPCDDGIYRYQLVRISKESSQ